MNRAIAGAVIYEVLTETFDRCLPGAVPERTGHPWIVQSGFRGISQRHARVVHEGMFQGTQPLFPKEEIGGRYVPKNYGQLVELFSQIPDDLRTTSLDTQFERSMRRF